MAAVRVIVSSSLLILQPVDNQVFDYFLRNISGADELAAKYGYYYTYTETPRAQIFRRNASSVVELVECVLLIILGHDPLSIDTMMALMRYNNFKEDPLSLQTPFCEWVL